MLGLSTPINGPPIDTKPASADNSNDIFGSFMSESGTNGKNPSTVPSSMNTNVTKVEPTLAQQEHDFFNQIPNEKEKAKLTKDSILALYGTAPSLPTNNQFMQGMPPLNVDNGSLFGGVQMSYQSQQPAFGMPANPTSATGMNNFAQFGMMQQAPQMNFQPTPTINSMPNQTLGFSNVQLNPSLQLNQANQTKTNTFPTTNVNNVNKQFGNLNVGNVWQ